MGYDRVTPDTFNLDTQNAENYLYEYQKTQTNKGSKKKEGETAVGGIGDTSSDYLKELLASKDPDYSSRDLKRHDRIIERQGNKVNRISDRINKNLEKGNLEKVDKLRAKLDDNAGDLGADIGDSVSADWGSGAITAAAKAPSIIAGLSGKPESKGEANARVLNSTVQFAQIGGSIVPGWGHAIGAVVGGITGAISNAGYGAEMLANANDEVAYKEKKALEERQQMYIKNKTSGQLELEANAYKKALGYTESRIG